MTDNSSVHDGSPHAGTCTVQLQWPSRCSTPGPEETLEAGQVPYVACTLTPKNIHVSPTGPFPSKTSVHCMV